MRVAGAPCQVARNSSTGCLFSGDQMAINGAEPVARAGPNRLRANLFAWQMTPEPSTTRAGHSASSNAKTASDFINGNLRLQFSVRKRFLKRNVPADPRMRVADVQRWTFSLTSASSRRRLHFLDRHVQKRRRQQFANREFLNDFW